MSYVVVDAGLQWEMKVEAWVLFEVKIETGFGVPQLFVKKKVSTIKRIVAKVTDDFLMSAKLKDIKEFIEELKQAFDIVKFPISGEFNINGCTIKLGDGRMEINMIAYSSHIIPVPSTPNST